MTTRTAQCQCGQLRVTTRAEPYGISICHCIACQRRGGSPFGVGAYFLRDDTVIQGDSHTFSRTGTSGGELVNHFCPDCGTTVYWVSAMHGTGIGVAVGSFADPAFPAPVRSVWENTRHPWFEPPCPDRFVEASSGPRIV